MTLVAGPATPGPWVDTSFPLTQHVCDALKAAGKVGVVRYVPLPGNSSHGDITAAELVAICGAGLECLLVQHVRLPGWDPGKHDGAGDGSMAGLVAYEAGYPDGAHVFLDLEGIHGSPFDTTGFAVDWQHRVMGNNLNAGLYVGYAVPLHPADLYELPGFDCYWSDAGPRHVATRGFAIKQGPEVTIAGVKFDTNTVAADLLGGLPWSCRAG